MNNVSRANTKFLEKLWCHYDFDMMWFLHICSRAVCCILLFNNHSASIFIIILHSTHTLILANITPICAVVFLYIQILLSNGTVYWISIDHSHGDITKITKDTSLVGKISLNTISDGKLLWGKNTKYNHWSCVRKPVTKFIIPKKFNNPLQN
mgnify:CR=1 FL=1